MFRKDFWRKLILLIGICRFVAVFFVFSFPLLAETISFILDTVDSLVAYRAKFSWPLYTRYDKLLDWWWYIFIFVYSINLPIFPVIFVLFILRSLGQMLTLITLNERFLFYFPNILEIYFLGYLLSKQFAAFSFLNSDKYAIVALVLATVIVIPREYLVHINKYYYGGRGWSKSIKDQNKSLKKNIKKFF